jgi:pyruvate dehydrogenase E1 component
MVPNCRAYDPAFAHEIAVIMDHGMRRMMEQQADEFYYITVANENYAQPSLPDDVAPDIIKGMYRLPAREPTAATSVIRLLGSGSILREVIAAAELLARDWNVASDTYSVTSFSELARDAREVERWNRLHPDLAPRRSHVGSLLDGDAPIVAATDYVRAYPQLIAAYTNGRFVALGTDGFGRSDTRSSLRNFFEVDRHHVVLAALDSLAAEGTLPRGVVAEAIRRYGLATETDAPWNV